MRTRICLLLTAALLSACAGMNSLRSDVSTFGEWPAERKAGTYAFDRLPSQQAQPPLQEALEAAARPALEAAGFKPAAEGAEAEVLVQIGGRVTRLGPSPWDDPFWWRGGYYGGFGGYYGAYYGSFYGGWRHGRWGGPYWGWYGAMDPPRYEREVALLIRDRSSGKPVYETRASGDGYSSGSVEILRAMFEAALKDFPAIDAKPRSVIVQLPG